MCGKPNTKLSTPHRGIIQFCLRDFCKSSGFQFNESKAFPFVDKNLSWLPILGKQPLKVFIRYISRQIPHKQTAALSIGLLPGPPQKREIRFKTLVRKLFASAASGRALLRREALLSLVLLPATPRLSARPAAVARPAFMRPARPLLGSARPLGPAAGRLSLAFLRASGRRGAGARLGLRLRLPPGAGGS